jgi:L-iditol 2-dehydrogenase
MKAAVVYGENEIRVTEVEDPQAKQGEVIVEVRASGICATDVKILGGRGLPPTLPTILGHEVAGVIKEVGKGISDLRPGEKVAIYPIAACGDCFYCRRGKNSLCLHEFGLGHGIDGGFAEFVRIPSQIIDLGGVIPIGELPFDLAAMAEPLSCALSVFESFKEDPPSVVGIIGAGPLGILNLLVAKHKGARVIISDPIQERLEVARNLGADATVDPRREDVGRVMTQFSSLGADLVIIAVGLSKVVEENLYWVRKGGTVNIFGGPSQGSRIEVDPRWLHYGEINLTGTFASSVDLFREALEMIKNREIEVAALISDRIPLEEILLAVEKVKDRKLLKAMVII